MHIRRGYLFVGVLLIPIGAITLLARNGTIDPAAYTDAWRLWPILLIGLGLAVLLGRSRAASLGTVIAGLAIGVLVGTAVATGPVWVASGGDCAPGSAATQQLARTGTFTDAATLELEIRCGTVALTTQPGSDWSFNAAYTGQAPRLDPSDSSLTVDVPSGTAAHHQDWTIVAPTDRLRAISLTANAATGSFVLGQASLASITVETNAGDVLIDGGSAAIGRIDVDVNAGRERITLGRSATVGTLSVNAGAIDLCVPADVNLQLDVKDQLTFLTNLAQQGLQQAGQRWTRTGSASAPLIALQIEGNVASLTLDPQGGCR